MCLGFFRIQTQGLTSTQSQQVFFVVFFFSSFFCLQQISGSQGKELHSQISPFLPKNLRQEANTSVSGLRIWSLSFQPLKLAEPGPYQMSIWPSWRPAEFPRVLVISMQKARKWSR